MINEKSDRFETIKNLVDNYDEEQVERFCDILKDCKERKIFVVGAGFAGTVAEYMVERLAVCGFMVFNRVHFYDLMMFNSSVDKRMVTNIEPSVIIAISQSGETEIRL
jgi:D-arabinose 5-phosphate isomerase GutQ